MGAGSSVGSSLGAGKVRPGAAGTNLFNRLGSQDIFRMSSSQSRLGSRRGSTGRLSTATGVHTGYDAPVALTNLRARSTSMDSYRMNPSMTRSSSSVSLPETSQTRSRPVVPQPGTAPQSGWRDMPPLEPPYAYHPRGARPVPARRTHIEGQPIQRAPSTSSLDSLSSESRPPSRFSASATNEGGSFLPQLREDFKLHNRVGDSFRTFQDRHPYLVKAGKYVGGGIAALGILYWGVAN